MGGPARTPPLPSSPRQTLHSARFSLRSTLSVSPPRGTETESRRKPAAGGSAWGLVWPNVILQIHHRAGWVPLPKLEWCFPRTRFTPVRGRGSLFTPREAGMTRAPRSSAAHWGPGAPSDPASCVVFQQSPACWGRSDLSRRPCLQTACAWSRGLVLCTEPRDVSAPSRWL